MKAARWKIDKEFYILDQQRLLATSGEADPAEAAKRTEIEQQKLSDGMWNLFGFDNLHLGECINHYKLTDNEQLADFKAKC